VGRNFIVPAIRIFLDAQSGAIVTVSSPARCELQLRARRRASFVTRHRLEKSPRAPQIKLSPHRFPSRQQ
jgi:hypothetical protein